MKWRRDLHAIPELIFDLPKTSKYIRERLEELGIPHRVVAETGIVGLIEGAKPGPTVALRADIDAIIQKEATGLPFASTNDYMHACGHDAHAAILLGTAKILSQHKAELRGTVKLLFQPAEEYQGGALPMIREGCMEDPRVDAVYGLHVGQLHSATGTGQVGIRVGAINASIDTIHIKVKGQGGHSARPHLCMDPVVVACEIVLGLQRIVSREINASHAVVLTVGQIHGGTNAHTIPDAVSFSATVRTTDPEDRAFIEERIKTIAETTAKAHRTEAEIQYLRYYPPCMNDAVITREFAASAAKVVGSENVIEFTEPSMGGDDMAYFLERAPGTYFTICTNNPDKGIVYPNHSAKFDVDEDTLWIGPAVYIQAILDYIESRFPEIPS